MTRSPLRITGVALVAVFAILGIIFQYNGNRDLGHFLIGGAVVGGVLFSVAITRADASRRQG